MKFFPLLHSWISNYSRVDSWNSQTGVVSWLLPLVQNQEEYWTIWWIFMNWLVQVLYLLSHQVGVEVDTILRDSSAVLDWWYWFFRARAREECEQ